MSGTKHPIGVTPRGMWEVERFHDLREAILRYLEADYLLKEEWIKEYNELLTKIKEKENELKSR